MGFQPVSNPNKNHIPQKFNNWFDEQKSRNSMFGNAWMEHVNPIAMPDGFVRMIPKFERGTVTYDMYPEAFNSSKFIANVIPMLDNRTRESKSLYNAMSKVDSNYINSLPIKSRNYIREKMIDDYYNTQEYIMFSQKLSAFDSLKDHTIIDQMMIEAQRLRKQRDFEKSKLEMELFNSVFVTEANFEMDKNMIREARRIIASIGRPRKFIVREFVNGLRTDTTILTYIINECDNANRYAALAQDGLRVSSDEFDVQFFGVLQTRILAYQRILDTFTQVVDILNYAMNTYNNTGVYVFPQIIETHLLSLQKTVLDNFKDAF